MNKMFKRFERFKCFNFLPKTHHFIFVYRFDLLCNTSIEEHLPEYGQNRRPKHVACYAVYNAIILQTCICIYWFYFS